MPKPANKGGALVIMIYLDHEHDVVWQLLGARLMKRPESLDCD